MNMNIRTIRRRWPEIKYKFKYGYIYKWQRQAITAFSFMKMAWKALRGKICIMDTELMDSNAGYKYKALIITKLPVSTKHTYEDL